MHTRPIRADGRRAWTAPGALLLVLLAGGLAACGSSGSSDSTSSSPATSTAAATAAAPKCGDGSGKAATGTPISVGGMTTASGGVSAVQGAKTVKAYFDCLNANGGVNGRPVEYTSVDDGLNPATAARGAATLVNDKKVVGIVGGSYLECPVAGPIYAKAGVYEIDGVGASAQCFTSKNIASVSMGAPLAGSSITDALIAGGAKKIALLLPNIPGLGDALKQAAERTAKANGATIVKSTLYKPGVKDATSLVLAAASANPDGIGLAGIKSDLVTILKTAEAQKLKDRFKFASVNQLYAPEVPKALTDYWAGGALQVQHQFGPIEATTPDVGLWKAVVKQYAPGTPTDEVSEGMFLAAKMFGDTLKGIQGPITAASVATAIQGIRDYQTDMLCAPFSWGKLPFRVGNVQTRVASVDGDQWKDDGGCKQISDPILKGGG
jgi:branched-chain amino acid transport system substrate-binding protein